MRKDHELINDVIMKNAIKIIKNLVREGYKQNSHHGDTNWRKALEDAEELLIENKKNIDKIKNKLDNLYKEKELLKEFTNGEKVWISPTNGQGLRDRVLKNKSEIEILKEML